GPAQPRPQPAREQRGGEERPERELEPLAPVAQSRAVLRAHAADLRVIDSRAAGAFDARPDLVARRGEAGEGEARDEEGEGEKKRLRGRVPALDAQPVMHAERE